MKKTVMVSFAVMTAVSLIFGLLGCVSNSKSSSASPKKIVYQEIALKDLKEASKYSKRTGFIIKDNIIFVGDHIFALKSNPKMTFLISELPLGNDADLIRARVIPDKEYTFYISTNYNLFKIDRVEGEFRSVEEVRAELTAKSEAERLAKGKEEKQKAEAERLAQEKFRAKFTVIPDQFKPDDYVAIDLFKAVANSKNLNRASNKQEAFLGQLQSAFALGLGGDYFLQYKSDLTFVRQNGTDITFSSDDKAISQEMSIDQRSGLQAGQKVRVYYLVTRAPLITWDVIAIERR